MTARSYSFLGEDLSDIDNETMRSELEALQSIYGEEITINPSETSKNEREVIIKVKASQKVGDEASAVSWLRNLLAIQLAVFMDITTYPQSLPIFELKRICGIADEELETLKAQLNSYEAEPDCPVLFDFIQIAQEFLDAVDLTSLLCSICLSEFSEECDVALTSCGHLFHRLCLGRHIYFHEEKVAEELKELPPGMEPNPAKMTPYCPACRSSIEGEFSSIQESTEESASITSELLAVTDLSDWRKRQEELKILFETQQQKGAIIDLEQEQKKNLVTENTFVPITKSVNESENIEDPSDKAETSKEKDTSIENQNNRGNRRNHRGVNYTRGNQRRSRGRSKPNHAYDYSSRKEYKYHNSDHAPSEGNSYHKVAYSNSSYNNVQKPPKANHQREFYGRGRGNGNHYRLPRRRGGQNSTPNQGPSNVSYTSSIAKDLGNMSIREHHQKEKTQTTVPSDSKTEAN